MKSTHRPERSVASIQHPAAYRREIVRADGKIHDEVRACIHGDLQFFELVAFPRVSHAASEVGVYFRGEHAPDACRLRVLVIDVQGNHRLAARDCRANSLCIDVFAFGHFFHGLCNDARTGGF